MEIKTFKFNDGTPAHLKHLNYGTNWPVVSIINNTKEAYVCETTDVSIRSNQHLANKVRRSLNTINVITDKTFNKSVILDLEAFLIKYMAADQTFKLQNSNGGMQNHNYYQREKYEKEFKNIWIRLKSKGLVRNDLKTIENSDLFKYSPYKTLTVDQYMIANDILSVLAEEITKKQPSIFVVHGGFGTGKTILGIYLLKLLCQAKNSEQIEVEENDLEYNLSEMINNNSIKDFKIGLVIPMDNLRATLKKVFKEVKGLNSKMVLSPNDVAKSDDVYDLLIVDESHRLRRRQNLTQYKSFDNNNDKLCLGKNGTELDWILLKSKYQILLYDENQSIKPTDVRKEDFNQLMLRKNYHPYYLETQLRCLLGGNEYVDYVKAIFSDNSPQKKIRFKKYDFKIYDNVNDMVETIKEKDKEYGLCRNVAGYAWAWKSKGTKLPLHITQKDINNIVSNGIYDIEIDGYKYIWNTKTKDWINSQNSVNEIGSIHTIQGFDLNYVGIIIGNELKYDNKDHKFIVDRTNYYDTKGKSATDDKELLQYILNIYCTMCTRGMLGTYLYICDDGLRAYLKKYIDVKEN